MHTVQPSVQARHRDSLRESDSPYIAWAMTSATTHFLGCAYSNVGINMRWLSGTYFLLDQLVPQCSITVDAAS